MDPNVIALRGYEARREKIEKDAEMAEYYAHKFLTEEKYDVITELSHELLAETVNNRLPDDPPYGAMVLMHYLNGDDRKLGERVREWIDGHVEREAWARAVQRGEDIVRQIDEENGGGDAA